MGGLSFFEWGSTCLIFNTTNSITYESLQWMEFLTQKKQSSVMDLSEFSNAEEVPIIINSFLNLCYGVANNLTNNFPYSFHVSPESRAFVIIIVGILSVIALFFLALIGAFLGYTRISDRKRGTILSKTINGRDTLLSFVIIRPSLTSLQSEKI
jgi:nitric oxide reductase large subunit